MTACPNTHSNFGNSQKPLSELALGPERSLEAYTLFLTRSADKAQRKLDKPLRALIRNALMRLLQYPFDLGEALRSPLGGVYSHHITYQGKEFRIAYQVDTQAQRLIVLLIGPHENFYRKLQNLLSA